MAAFLNDGAAVRADISALPSRLRELRPRFEDPAFHPLVQRLHDLI
ncbi:MAG: hypothetical protein WCP98_09540 [Actinomycetes bacterium]